MSATAEWRLCLPCEVAWPDRHGSRCWCCDSVGMFKHGFDPAKLLLLETSR